MTNGARHTSGDSSARWPERLTQAAFGLVLVLVLARALTLETLRDPFDPVPGGGAVPRAAGPAMTIALDWLGLIPALLVLVRRAVDPGYRLRRPTSMLPMALLAGWALMSASWASDRFVAVVGASHFASAMAVLWATTQLVRSWLRLRLVAAACFGLLLALTAHGLIYRFVEVPDNRQNYLEHREEFLKERGWEAGSFMAVQFEKKVMSGEMVGLNASPNTFAAMLVMLSVVTLGLVVQRWRDGDAPGWIALMLAPLPATAVVIFLTNSRAALITPLLAAGALGVYGLARGFLARHRTLLLTTGLAGFVIGAVGVVVLGLYSGGLGHDSLTFRWRYWTGAARIVQQHPVLGVGWNNFGDRYLAVRDPIASEEVKDPHNLFIRFTTELGLIGGALAVAWLIALAIELTRPRTIPDDDQAVSPPHRRNTRYDGPQALSILLKIAAGAGAACVLAGVDFEPGWEWFLIELLKRLLFTGLLLAGLILGSFRSFDRQELDTRPGCWILSAIVVAVGVFMLHNAIDFSFFETGPLLTLCLLCGAALGVRGDGPRQLLTTGEESDAAAAPVIPAGAKSKITRLGAAVVAAALALIAAVGIVGPLVVAEARARDGDVALRASRFPLAAQHYAAASDALPFSNSDYLDRAARAHAYAGAPLDTIRRAIERAIDANPGDPGYRRDLANVAARMSPPDVSLFRSSYEAMLAIDPNNVTARLDFADGLEQFGLNREAAQQIREAIRLDALLHPDEPKRLGPERIRTLNDRAARLGG